MRIRELAPGKINLCLFLGPLRDDGRHELVTLYESVSLADAVVIGSGGEADEVVAPGVEGPNLVARALEGLRRLGWEAPPLRVEIEKRVPIAAGMGGGSADAAALLRVAPRVAPVDASLLAELAAELGSDVPAQLTPGVALGVGAGEVVRAVGALAEHAVVIVPLSERLATPDVYVEADRLGLPRDASELGVRREKLEGALLAGQRLPDHLLVNDLEPAARSLCPAIEGALEALRALAADNVLVCGSGPTTAGLYWGSDSKVRADAAADAMLGRFPGAVAVRPVSSPA